MKLLIYGSDTEKSRDFYYRKKNEYSDHLFLEGEGLTFDSLYQISKNKSLFADDKSIFIENLFSKNKSNSVELKRIIEYINVSKDLNYILWEESEVAKATLAKLKNFEAVLFTIPQKLFAFLDQIRPGNSKQLIRSFHELRQTEEDELIFFMLVRQFRLYLQVLGNYRAQIDEVKRMAPWQLSKLRSQVKNFNEELLLSRYKQLFIIENNHKTGKISFPLAISIDFFLNDL